MCGEKEMKHNIYASKKQIHKQKWKQYHTGNDIPDVSWHVVSKWVE